MTTFVFQDANDRSELDRKNNEYKRINDEKQRKIDESNRITKENERITKENERIRNENQRKLDENSRLEAEKDRRKGYSDFITAIGDSNLEGTIEAEVIGARGDATNLKERFDGISESLTEFGLLFDYKRKQQALASKLILKLKDKKSEIRIGCQGDSLTHGMDTLSSDRRPAPDIYDDLGRKDSLDIAGITYPEALQRCLNEIYNNRVTVLNYGFSGDTAYNSWQRWFLDKKCDVKLIMLGTNDSQNDKLEQYIVYIKKIIERNLLQNSAVILLTPPRRRRAFDYTTSDGLYAGDEKTDAYRSALFAIGDEYGVPVVDMGEIMANYGAECYIDGVHFNSKGYNILGSRVASLFIGETIFNPKIVTSNSTVSIRSAIDGCTYFGNSTWTENSSIPTPNEVTTGKGIYASLQTNGGIIYSFYSGIEDVIVSPAIYFTGDLTTIECSVDFETEIPNTTIGYGIKDIPNHNFRPENPVVISRIDANVSNDKYMLSGIKDINSKKIHITGKGWHTIKLTCKTASASILGLQFISYYDLLSRIEALNNMQYVFQTHKNYNSSDEVRTSIVNIPTLFSAIKYREYINEYWKNPPIKISVFNFDKCYIEYFVTVNTSGTFKLMKNYNKYDISDNPSGYRELESVTRSGEELMLNWKGNVNRATSIIISKA